ncbi:DUF2705 family protein [Peribacillus frigoritolerans]|uniref:DUF2705 family protein n=1 Tax=Peribacillus frigoritolerans TaxID=450367 RepID=UPI00215B0072|nr:DUF2705 family protein [Peribacillus frigoritolerans]MCR8872004.1 DUF2705 family protein [Peribacillus frigoritolerans]
MIHSNKIFIFVVITIIIQAVLMRNFDFLHTGYLFLDGVPITSSYQLESKFLLYWYLPIVAMSFYFTGYFKKIVQTYGKLILIREYNKTKWMLIRYFLLMRDLILFVFCQISVFSIDILLQHNELHIVENLQKIFMYYLSLLIIFSIQLLLELLLDIQIAQLIINIYIVISVIAVKMFFTNDVTKFIYYTLIPNYGMGFRNGLSNNVPLFQSDLINSTIGLYILLSLQILLVVISIVKFKKIDIL